MTAAQVALGFLQLAFVAALLLLLVGAWDVAARWGSRLMGWLERVESRRRDF